MSARYLTVGFALALAVGLALVSLTVAGSSRAGSCAAPSSEQLTFTYQGDAIQRASVPAGVREARVEVIGAHGGQTGDTGKGGSGGMVYATLPVTAGQCLEVWVADWGEGTQWGYGRGGDKGDQWGPGHDGRAGGGGSAIAVNGQVMVVAGGGGGAGGNAAAFDGGKGGDGAGGAGPGTAQGGDGGNGQGVPVTTYINLGGLGGWESGHDGGEGETGTIDPFAGTGGGGGGGTKGGGGGATWVGNSQNNLLKPVGGGGGGGGDSWVAGSASDVQILVDDRGCTGGSSCQGLVTVDWIETPADVKPYAGSGQSTPVTSPFRSSLEAQVIAASGDPVPGTDVTFTLPPDGPSGTFNVPGSPHEVTATTNANGIATSPSLTADAVAGSWNATATVPNVKGAARYAMANQPAKTTTAVYAAPEPSAAGEPVRIAARVAASPSTVGDPVGKVSFEVDGSMIADPVPVVSGVAISVPVLLAVGPHHVSASFDGDGNFAHSSAQVIHQVDKAQATVELLSGQNPSAEGEEVSVQATVKAATDGVGDPTGKVQFTVDGQDQGPPQPLASGSATAALTFAESGSHVVRALYSGDATFMPASGALVQSVGPEATAVTLTSSDAAPEFGGPLSFEATVAGALTPSGEVTFTAEGDGSPIPLCDAVATDPSGQAVCASTGPLPAGSYEIVAAFEPDNVGEEPSTGRLSQLIRPAPTETELTATPDPLTFGQTFSATAGVGPPVGPVVPRGQIRFSVDGAAIGSPIPTEAGEASLPGDSTPQLGAGVHHLSASFSGDPDFRPGSASHLITVDPQGTVTTLRSTRNPSANGARVGLVASVSPQDGEGEVDGGVQFWADGQDRGPVVPLTDGVASTTLTGLRPGLHDIRAYYSSPEDYWPSEAKISQTVNSPPPAPEGIYPCRPWRVAVTAVWRAGNQIRVEGAARMAMRGDHVHIMHAGKPLTRVAVRADGTFWAAAPMPRVRRPGRVRIYAIVDGRRSRARQLAQRIGITARVPNGQDRQGRAVIGARVLDPGRRRLLLVRQRGCRLSTVKSLRGLTTDRQGRARVALPRPRAGQPFAVYRLMSGSARYVSPPLIVRAPRPARRP